MSGAGPALEIVLDEDFHLAPEQGIERFFTAEGALDPLRAAETRRRPSGFENKDDFDDAVCVLFDGEPERIHNTAVWESRALAPCVARVAAFTRRARIRLELVPIHRMTESPVQRSERQARRFDPRPVVQAIDRVEVRARHVNTVARQTQACDARFFRNREPRENALLTILIAIRASSLADWRRLAASTDRLRRRT